MKKLLIQSITAMFTILCLQACSKEDNYLLQDIPFDETTKDSSIDLDGKTYSTWIKDASYCIGIYNTETKDKIVEFPTVIEGGVNQTANLYFGETKKYTIQGCYILDIIKNEKDVYMLLEYSEEKYGLGITELLILHDNKITKRIKYANTIGRPNKLMPWYDKEIVATANENLSRYASDDFYIYSSGLDLIYKSAKTWNYDSFLNAHPIDTYRFIQADGNYIILKDIKEDFNEVWRFVHGDKDAIVKRLEVDVNEEIVEIVLELVYKDGAKETKSFKLNIEDGSLIE